MTLPVPVMFVALWLKMNRSTFVHGILRRPFDVSVGDRVRMVFEYVTINGSAEEYYRPKRGIIIAEDIENGKAERWVIRWDDADDPTSPVKDIIVHE